MTDLRPVLFERQASEGFGSVNAFCFAQTDSHGRVEQMLRFACGACQAQLKADESQAGKPLRCPKCRSLIMAPQFEAVGAAADASSTSARPQTPPPLESNRPPNLPRPVAVGGRRFGFNCGYCSSRLEAVESQSNTKGNCPTCGNEITVPILDRYGRLIDPDTGRIIKQDPHPVHAYAAAGERAPRILRREDGTQVIQCPRCPAVSPIDSNNCRACGMPFTMEGTTADAAGNSNGIAVTSMTLGIIGLFTSCVPVLPVLAIIFGGIAISQISASGSGSGRGMAIAGIVLGGIGTVIGAIVLLS